MGQFQQTYPNTCIVECIITAFGRWQEDSLESETPLMQAADLCYCQVVVLHYNNCLAESKFNYFNRSSRLLSVRILSYTLPYI